MFDLIGKRRWFFALSLLVTIPGLIFILLTPISGGKLTTTPSRTVPLKFRLWIDGIEITSGNADLSIAPCSGGSAVLTIDLTFSGGRWMGHLDTSDLGIGCFTADSFPVFDRFCQNAYFIADSNHGYKMIGVGKLVADDVTGKESELLQPFRENFIGHTREFVTGSFFTPDADPKFVNKVAYDMSLAPPAVAVPAMQALLRMDLVTLLPEVRVPVVAINSSLGQPVDEARIKKVLPSFKAVTLENTGHFLMMEEPERFNAVLLEEIEGMAPHS